MYTSLAFYKKSQWWLILFFFILYRFLNWFSYNPLYSHRTNTTLSCLSISPPACQFTIDAPINKQGQLEEKWKRLNSFIATPRVILHFTFPQHWTTKYGEALEQQLECGGKKSRNLSTNLRKDNGPRSIPEFSFCYRPNWPIQVMISQVPTKWNPHKQNRSYLIYT